MWITPVLDCPSPAPPNPLEVAVYMEKVALPVCKAVPNLLFYGESQSAKFIYKTTY